LVVTIKSTLDQVLDSDHVVLKPLEKQRRPVPKDRSSSSISMSAMDDFEGRMAHTCLFRPYDFLDRRGREAPGGRYLLQGPRSRQPVGSFLTLSAAECHLSRCHQDRLGEKVGQRLGRVWDLH